MRPKYSIILPTLNGAKTLAVTLPAMLRIYRDDVEWVISENHSDDATYDLVRDIAADDERVRVVRPPQRLPLGKHLEFAYRHASGRWLSHLGDDDHLLPWRFDLLDQVLEDAGERCSLVRGEYLRYNWPEYPERDKVNSLDPAVFHRTLEVVGGRTLAAELLNRVHIHGGGAWSVRSDVVQHVRRRCGCFASPQHVEFFAMRAAATLSEQVALVGLPLFILGRHGKSSGSQYFLPKQSGGDQSWDWSFEDPQGYEHCPFNWKSYSTLSFDAALTVQSLLPEDLGAVPIHWQTWSKTIHSEMLRLVRHRQLPPQARRDFLAAARRTGTGWPLYWRWRTLRQRWSFKRPPEAPFAERLISDGHTIELPGRIAGRDAGFSSIVDVPDWLASASQGQLSSLERRTALAL